MSKSTPSLVALLGLLAVAGYQNRDRIGNLMKNASSPTDGSAPPTGLLDQLSSLFNGSSGGRSLSEGLGALVDRFKSAGHGPAAESWVSTGPNSQMTEADIETAIGPDTIDQIERATGLSRSNILSRLSRALPAAVDHMTPQGHIPSPTEAQEMV